MQSIGVADYEEAMSFNPAYKSPMAQQRPTASCQQQHHSLPGHMTSPPIPASLAGSVDRRAGMLSDVPSSAQEYAVLEGNYRLYADKPSLSQC